MPNKRSGIRSIDFYTRETVSTDWINVEFSDQHLDNPEKPIFASAIRIENVGAEDIEISFNEDRDRSGIILAGETKVFRTRYESSVALRRVDGGTGETNVDVYAW